jgi:iron complex outermembrane recepter protein
MSKIGALLASASIPAFMISTLVLAPTAALAAEENAASENSGYDEIIVTARRRGEDLAKVPASVSAISADAIAQKGIVQQADLQSAVPGLVVRETQTNNQLNYAIRGQTVDAFSGSSTAVVPYVNEVPFVTGGTASFFDLESIQVVKGPQGTLFGRNTTGGAVLSTTARPKNELGGNIKAGYGNYDAFNVEGAINLPLVEDKVLFRGAFRFAQRDGYIRNVYTGKVFGGGDNSRLGALNTAAFRGSLLLKPAPGIENLMVFQYERSKGNNSGSQIYSVNKCGDVGADGTPLVCSAYSLFGPQIDGIFGPGTWASILAANPGFNPGGIQAALARQKNQLGFWEVDSDAPSLHRGKDWFVTNTTSIDIGENTKIKNIFGYTDSNSLDSSEQNGEPFAIIETYNALTGRIGNDVTNKSVSDELQLQGKVLGGGLEYIVGAYYQQLKTHIIFPQTYFLAPPALPASPGSTTTSNFITTDTSKAVFAHGTFDLGRLAGLDGLKLSAGVRYSWEDIGIQHQPGGTFFPLTSNDFKDSRASWNVGLEYQAMPQLLLYAVARESWRSGGINGVAPPNLSATLTNTDKFQSEVAQDFEGGLKYSGRLAGRPARLFLSAYTMRVKNIQRALFPVNPVNPSLGAIALTVNVPEARIKGLELEAGIQPADWLDIGVTAALTDATFTKNIGLPFGNPVSFGPVADAPKYSGSAYVVITLPISDGLGKMRLRGDVFAQSKFYFSNTNNSLTPGTQLPGYSLVNFRFDWGNITSADFRLAARLASTLPMWGDRACMGLRPNSPFDLPYAGSMRSLPWSKYAENWLEGDLLRTAWLACNSIFAAIRCLCKSGRGYTSGTAARQQRRCRLGRLWTDIWRAAFQSPERNRHANGGAAWPGLVAGPAARQPHFRPDRGGRYCLPRHRLQRRPRYRCGDGQTAVGLRPGGCEFARRRCEDAQRVGYPRPRLVERQADCGNA